MELRVLAHAMLPNKASNLLRENTYDHLPRYDYVYNKAREAAKECQEEMSRWVEQARHPQGYFTNADMLRSNVQFTTKTQGDMQVRFIIPSSEHARASVLYLAADAKKRQ